MDLDSFFAEFPSSRPIFQALITALEKTGKAEVRVSKSQIAFGRGKDFAWAWIPDRYLGGGHAPLVLSVALRRRDASPRWKEVVEPRAGRFMHHLELYSAADIDGELVGWLEEAKACRQVSENNASLQEGPMRGKKLSKTAFEASRRFLETEGRPLEWALFRYEFEGGPREAALLALAGYQNPDGGFGHALEPDFRSPVSSVLCTTIAFQVLRSLGIGSSSPLVSGGIEYLTKTFDPSGPHWRIIPSSLGPSPRAPWWKDDAAFDAFSLNPTAEVLGYLYDFREQVPYDILTVETERVIEALSGAENIKMHELLCCLRLLKSKNVPEETQEKLFSRMEAFIDSALERDSGKWGGYALRPLQVVESPHSPFLAGRAEAVEENLDYEIDSMNADGSWTPNWDWGGAYPEEWARAQKEWSGVITLEKLKALRAFGRIEDASIVGYQKK